MESIIIPIILYIISKIFGKEKNKNKTEDLFGDVFKDSSFRKIKKDAANKFKMLKPAEYENKELNEKHSLNNMGNSKTNELVNSDKIIKDMKSENKVLKTNIIKNEELNEEIREDKNLVFEMFSNSDDLTRSIIMSEVLSKPKSLR